MREQLQRIQGIQENKEKGIQTKGIAFLRSSTFSSHEGFETSGFCFVF